MKRDSATRFSFDAFSRRLARRRVLGGALAAGIGAKLLTSSSLWPGARTSEAAGPFDNFKFKGITYDGFPAPYDPSTANSTCIFFGSDASYDAIKPLWGDSYTSKTGKKYPGRNDLVTMRNMGVQIIRLYDWEPRNYHKDFLDTCLNLGIQVLAPVSNYFLKDGYNNRAQNIPVLIRSMGNAANNGGGTDYHPAIVGLIIGNEPAQPDGFPLDRLVQFTKDWVDAEASSQFSGFRQLPISHCVDFGLYGGQFPGWSQWDQFIPSLNAYNVRNLPARLFLSCQTYQTAEYLFQNAEGSGKAYVKVTFDKYGKPLFFSEFGYSRNQMPGSTAYLGIIDKQLRGAIAYALQNPGQLLGVTHFMFADKVWKCPQFQGCTDTEGGFGVFSHSSQTSTIVTYKDSDFTHYDGTNCNGQQLRVDVLVANPSFQVVKDAYTTTPTPTPKPTATPTVTPTVGPTTTPTAKPTTTPSPTPPAGGISAKVLSASSAGGGLYNVTLEITLGGALALNDQLQVRIAGKVAFADSGSPMASSAACGPIPSPYFKDGSASNNRYDLNIAGNACGAGSVITVTQSVKGPGGTTFTQSVTSTKLGSATTPPFTL